MENHIVTLCFFGKTEYRIIDSNPGFIKVFESITVDYRQESTSGGGNAHNLSVTSLNTGAAGINYTTPNSDSQQFSIFPAIFSRQLNFPNNITNQSKLMEEIRPNLVGGLLGLQHGLLEENSMNSNQTHHNGQDSKFISLQEGRLSGLSAHENRLLGIPQDLRGANGFSDNKLILQRKSTSTPDDFNNIYTGVGSIVEPSHNQTPSHSPSSRLADQSGKF